MLIVWLRLAPLVTSSIKTSRSVKPDATVKRAFDLASVVLYAMQAALPQMVSLLAQDQHAAFSLDSGG